MGKSRTQWLKSKYNRMARYYDLFDTFAVKESMRRKAIGSARGEVLEVGAGTGKNLPLYPPDCKVTGVDLSSAMLDRAKERTQALDMPVQLQEGDVQNLDFADASFDTVVATFVFCTVPDPVKGLLEVRRVCKGEGMIILLEHVRSENSCVGFLMDLLNPVTSRLLGDNINRQTVDYVKAAGICIQEIQDCGAGLVKLIRGQP